MTCCTGIYLFSTAEISPGFSSLAVSERYEQVPLSHKVHHLPPLLLLSKYHIVTHFFQIPYPLLFIFVSDISVNCPCKWKIAKIIGSVRRNIW